MVSWSCGVVALSNCVVIYLWSDGFVELCGGGFMKSWICGFGVGVSGVVELWSCEVVTL